MANENYGQKKKVTRQSWKPTGFLGIAHKAWLTFYSVLKIIMAAVATVLGVAAVCAVVFVVTLGNYLEQEVIPNAEVSLEGFDLSGNSVIYYTDENGDIQVLQKLYAESNRQRAKFEEIPEAMIHAAVAIEDKRFFEHQGIDWITTIKACVNMFFGDGDFGGSSITQQLIKNLFEADDVAVYRKVQEIFRAAELEQRYDKSVIITWYLNEIYLGNRIYGVKTAASYYFGKELEMLTPAECASLISITNNPSIFDPTLPYNQSFVDSGWEGTGFERNHTRKENTLWMMRNEGYLTEEEYQEALAQELVLKRGIDPEDRMAQCPNDVCGYRNTVGKFNSENGKYTCPNCGAAVEPEKDASEIVYSWFVDTVIEDVCREFATQDGLSWDSMDKEAKASYKALICGAGYHIYSTLDMKVQSSIDAIYQDLSKIPTDKSLQQLQSGMVIIDNETGDIVGMAGGVGDNKGHDDYNRATDAKLQPGSSVKPLTVYAPGFELGMITPATVIKDMPLYYTGTKGTRPFPYNDDRSYSYSSTIQNAVKESINAVAVNTLDSMGLEYSFNFAKYKFGLSNYVSSYKNAQGTVFTDINYAPLGMGAPTFGVTVRQMATAYATFANNGIYREARTFTKIINSKGVTVLKNTQDSQQILSEKTVQYMNWCLDQAVASGTGTAADISGQNVAGKTGTTSSAKDRWFCGFTSYYTGAVWCGYDTPEVITLTGSNKQNPACRLFKAVLAPVHKGLSKVPLYNSSMFEEITVCLDCGKLATDACSIDARYYNTSTKRTAKAKVYAEDIPYESCDCHVIIDFCSSSNCAANEYCKEFAKLGQTQIVKRSLVKTTKSGLEAIRVAAGKGLNQNYYYYSNYIYLVDKDGKPIPYFGIFDNVNEGLSVPYTQCSVHTQASWEAYLTGTE